MNIVAKPLKDDKTEIIFMYEKDIPKEYSYLSPVFKANAKEIYTLVHSDKEGTYTFLIGLGDKKKLTLETIRNLGGKIARKVRDMKLKAIEITKFVSNYKDDEVVTALVQGIHLGLYTFNKYKSDNKKDTSIDFHITGFDGDVKDIIKQTLALTESIRLARDLINEPSSVLYPEMLAKIAKEEGEKAGLEVEILEEEQIEDLGMNAMLAVGNGSVNKPRFIIMRHLKGKDKKRFGLVGKGITCDTGGYSLKQSDSMHYQKADMSGAANIIAIMCALSKNNVQENVVAVIPSCENVISAYSYKIGDILKTMNGKTIEVLNTDAEGRLALADAITYIISKEKADSILDMATLTGAVGAMFGNIYSGLLSNNDKFCKRFMEMADKEEEKFFRLPTDQAYRDMINSDVADIKNTGGCGTITAGLFLREFVEDKPWIHLDIAATACKAPSTDYEFVGGTGVAVRTIYNLIKCRNEG